MPTPDQQAASNTYRSLLDSLHARSQDENFQECIARAVFLRDFAKAGELFLGAYLDDIKERAGHMPASIDVELFGGDLGDSIHTSVSYEKVGGYIKVLSVYVVTERQVPLDLFKEGLLSDDALTAIMDEIISTERHSDAA